MLDKIHNHDFDFHPSKQKSSVRKQSKHLHHNCYGNSYNNWHLAVIYYFKLIANRKSCRAFKTVYAMIILSVIILISITAISLTYRYVDFPLVSYLSDNKLFMQNWFQITTDVGKSEWFLLPTISIVLLLSFYHRPWMNRDAILHWHKHVLLFLFASSAVILSGLLSVLLKNLVGRARPKFTDLPDLWLSQPFTDTYKFASFPSGHATTLGAIAMLAILLVPRWGWVFLPVAIWGALSRVMIGVHFPSDVIAGLLLGASFTFIYAHSFAYKRLLFTSNKYGVIKFRY